MVAHHPLAPAVRVEFAKRLRQLRTEKGFAHARELARALGIEENRYTRYERAEVEPSLTLIHKICVTLQVSPNDLLDFTESGP
jgi:transcriptional regulator with XRE-family HTH domain